MLPQGGTIRQRRRPCPTLAQSETGRCGIAYFASVLWIFSLTVSVYIWSETRSEDYQVAPQASQGGQAEPTASWGRSAPWSRAPRTGFPAATDYHTGSMSTLDELIGRS